MGEVIRMYAIDVFTRKPHKLIGAIGGEPLYPDPTASSMSLTSPNHRRSASCEGGSPHGLWSDNCQHAIYSRGFA